MDNATKGGFARARSLTKAKRSSIARRAASVRWKKRGLGILERSEIKRQIVAALQDRNAEAYLFGSYARQEATSKSDVDILIVENRPTDGWMKETSLLRRRLNFDKPVDLILMDKSSYVDWKNEQGSIQFEIAKEGVRLV
jgi:predicted nucleotidyltransferase